MDAILTLLGYKKPEEDGIALLIAAEKTKQADLEFELAKAIKVHQKNTKTSFQKPSQNKNIQQIAIRLERVKKQIQILEDHDFSIQDRHDKMKAAKVQNQAVEIIADISQYDQNAVSKLSKETKRNRERIRTINQQSAMADNLLSMCDDTLEDIDVTDPGDSVDTTNSILNDLDADYIQSHLPSVSVNGTRPPTALFDDELDTNVLISNKSSKTPKE